MPAQSTNLTFNTLEENLAEKLGIDSFSTDVLRTLRLTVNDQNSLNQDRSLTFNNAAALLADQNSFAGIEVVKFGNSINEIRQRHDLSGASILTQYTRAIKFFRDNYIYQLIKGAERKETEEIPLEAFRETIANTLIHRAWDVPSRIRVSMFPDRIEVTSPGSLPDGLSADEYIEGKISIPRNLILADIFLRLGIIERLGTGIKRIRLAYRGSASQPHFDVSASTVRVTLPVVTTHNLTPDQQQILTLLSNKELSRASIQEATQLSRSTTISALNQLIDAHLVEKRGAGPSTTYART